MYTFFVTMIFDHTAYFVINVTFLIILGCGVPPTPVHGYTVLSRSSIDVALFNCMDGYDLIGSYNSHCSVNDAWIPASPPSCQGSVHIYVRAS